MATQTQRLVIADALRKMGSEAARAVADELDPPAPRTVTVQGVRFSYDRDLPLPWLQHRAERSAIAHEHLTQALASVYLTPTLAEYESLLNLQTETR